MSTTTTKTINLSDQALGAVMLALQNSLLDQSDIVPVLRGFNFVFNDEAELVVSNPPTNREFHHPKQFSNQLKLVLNDFHHLLCLKYDTETKE